ncbi:hypothetical protein LK07_07235 [Streptomyces pluripotens]|uniref:Uncharacterized protein n=1 Tax=Streptomyces pluripotens TaxID=1355015 RepID=A0A221NV77_9ACTN|nr:hypothetical protein LK06_006130 [Streptomyces pluripotens]ASN23850.1 hypothetical protein LK07_07235 [Streptomyces pluripotens]KIE24518.1 hypothetical protein LK08_24030 [Streptomyces sp. MUSC 125]
MRGGRRCAGEGPASREAGAVVTHKGFEDVAGPAGRGVAEVKRYEASSTSRDGHSSSLFADEAPASVAV